MKIFYGCQGTGNGHITRTRIMAKELAKAGHDVQYLFSGRDPAGYFDMEVFSVNHPVIYKKGLTFDIESGKVNLVRTILRNDYSTYLRDIDHLDLSSYDLVISDYEPITSWAAKCQGVECIGIGHQYAFNYDIPKSRNNFITDLVMELFAPASVGIGLHWDHFDQPILPPIIEVPRAKKTIKNKIVVYLPFEEPIDIVKMLANFDNFDFYVYGFVGIITGINHIHFENPSYDGFKNDLADCNGVICNAGFELASEALHLGKKLLVKPVEGQMEQHSNALALDQLKFGERCHHFDERVLQDFLETTEPSVQVKYPNVAKYIVEWLSTRGAHDVINPKNLWDKVVYKTLMA